MRHDKITHILIRKVQNLGDLGVDENMLLKYVLNKMLFDMSH